jgi:fluoroquinolone transport system permease protein
VRRRHADGAAGYAGTADDHLAYRLAAPMLISLAMTLIALPLAGLVSLSFLEVLLVAVAAAPLAPLSALFLGAYAANKVEGFALLFLLYPRFLPCG